MRLTGIFSYIVIPILGDHSFFSLLKYLASNDASFKFVKYWALRIMKFFRLRGFIILKSSKNHYHVVFDRSVTWAKNTHIMAWACVESKNAGLKKWFLMQCIKESSTLRVSPKEEKPSPRIVYRYGKQDNEIKGFWRGANVLREQ